MHWEWCYEKRSVNSKRTRWNAARHAKHVDVTMIKCNQCSDKVL